MSKIFSIESNNQKKQQKKQTFICKSANLRWFILRGTTEWTCKWIQNIIFITNKKGMENKNPSNTIYISYEWNIWEILKYKKDGLISIKLNG